MIMTNSHLRILRPLLIGATLVGALVLALTTAGQAQSGAGRTEPAPISPHLEARLARSSAPVPFLVILDDQLAPEPVVRAARAAGGDAVARRTALYQYGDRDDAGFRTGGCGHREEHGDQLCVAG